jgi:hypothetical protein
MTRRFQTRLSLTACVVKQMFCFNVVWRQYPTNAVGCKKAMMLGFCLFAVVSPPRVECSIGLPSGVSILLESIFEVNQSGV